MRSSGCPAVWAAAVMINYRLRENATNTLIVSRYCFSGSWPSRITGFDADETDVSSAGGTESATRPLSRHAADDAGSRERVSADLAHVRVLAASHGASGAVHAGDHARGRADSAGDTGADCGLHVVPERLSVLTEVARRSCG